MKVKTKFFPMTPEQFEKVRTLARAAHVSTDTMLARVLRFGLRRRVGART